MLYKTRGIVLKHIKYSETSIIVTIYTERFGRQAYIINGVRSKKAKIKANTFQALFLLDMEVYHKPKNDLQRAKEIQNAYVFSSLPYDIKKSTLAIFIAEILHKTIQEQEPNPDLFEFLYNTIQLLDLKENGMSNFHIYFLIRFTKYLGFYPHNNYSETNCYFDLKAGSFKQIKPMHMSFMDQGQSLIFSQMLQFSEDQHENLKFDYKHRIQILEKILEYYALHNEGVSKIRSLDVLKEVFH
ncbi:MAG TPA: DNA repair protein RecO [Bacteroidales bacterium]|nr:DNA repair protein RecO [Bacteroidales bacterium]